jgi:hypothetical protein
MRMTRVFQRTVEYPGRGPLLAFVVVGDLERSLLAPHAGDSAFLTPGFFSLLAPLDDGRAGKDWRVEGATGSGGRGWSCLWSPSRQASLVPCRLLSDTAARGGISDRDDTSPRASGGTGGASACFGRPAIVRSISFRGPLMSSKSASISLQHSAF